MERARADPSCGLSTDDTFRSSHHDRRRGELCGRDVLGIDTGSLSLAQAARAVVDWVTPDR